ncbi:hypothetical protein [Paracraurococcus ruber]|uniref:Uncharacterized protein n=1 Tax=Paracraurococcus ruber TaxID=77675 RepID=A0ABS1CWB5_9PROT|nr:hypothetical protein [Paracraurococcus ruber]MBK1658705.1 hypothetical protein [Paracraurococcus ruber]TDG32214.1 hypothetical protein E2C05_08110 [Paracraurococcus ruber]
MPAPSRTTAPALPFEDACLDTGRGRAGFDAIRIAHRAYRLMPRDFRQRLFARLSQRLAPRPHPAPLPPAGGVVLVGEFGLPTGVGAGARLMRDALLRLGVRV